MREVARMMLEPPIMNSKIAPLAAFALLLAPLACGEDTGDGGSGGAIAPGPGSKTDPGGTTSSGNPPTSGNPSTSGGDPGTDAGSNDAGSNPDGGTQSLKPVFVAVGYGALRVRSIDLGLTWIDKKTEGTSGDNEYLIRGIGWGNGKFVAARGFPSGKVRVSSDGANWTSFDAPSNQWMAAVVYTGTKYVAVGSGQSWTSNDGQEWTVTNPFNTGVRTMVLGGTRLVAAGQNGTWWRSDNSGATWSIDSMNHIASNEVKIAYCGTSFMDIGNGNYANMGACSNFKRTRGAVHAEGVYLRAIVGGGGIERSTNGTSWTKVYNVGVEDIEIGYVP
jgi:hypothetical protein